MGNQASRVNDSPIHEVNNPIDITIENNNTNDQLSTSPHVEIPLTKSNSINNVYGSSYPVVGSLLTSLTVEDANKVYSTSVPPILQDIPPIPEEEKMDLDTEETETGTQELIPTVITWKHGGNKVFVMGSFNRWTEKVELKRSESENDFSTVLVLKPGTHRIKFVVDDEWKCSTDLVTAADPRNQLVNVIEVTGRSDSFFKTTSSMSDGTQTPSGVYGDGAYSNKIPDFLLQESNDSRFLTSPLGLPPQLTNVLLNATPVCETDYSTLPNPNHVTLYHMYAQSIRDGVMALGITSRYNRKYTTSILYRPVFGE